MKLPAIDPLDPRPHETIASLSRRARDVLISIGLEPEEARSDVRALLTAACGFSTADLIAREEDRIGDKAAALFAVYLARRQAREPVSKILGTRAFWEDEFHINADVLDPRADTELIISLACAMFAAHADKPLRILDLGTGSGALLCSLLREFPHASGLGVDLSATACDVARHNLDRLGLSGRGEIKNCGWDDVLDQTWEIIVSNPPYIESSAIRTLQPEVRLWDPELALDGGHDGLDAYRSLAKLLPGLLAREGKAFLEIGFDQGLTAAQVMESGSLRVLAVHNDLEGRPRVLEISH